MVPFFPNFIKLDKLTAQKVKVLDVAIGGTSIYFLTEDKTLGNSRLFSIGCGELG